MATQDTVTSPAHAARASSDEPQTSGTPADEPILLNHVSTSGVCTLTLNRPEQFNALSHAMLDALQEAVDSLPASVRVVVIAARGKAFCAGHDLKEMRSHIDEAWQRALFTKCSHFMESLIRLPQPVIAKVQGVAAAAGCQLVANCDLAVAAEHCSFGVSGINLGLFCSTPSVALSRNISRKRAFHMLITGDYIDATTAADWGLVNLSVPADELDEAVDALCGKIAGKSRVAVTTGKQLFYSQIDKPLDQALSLASTTMAQNMMAADVSEGIDAFFDKRPPHWQDR